MEPSDEQIGALFGKLDTQLRNRQTKRALKTTDEILKLRRDDQDALHCRAALLIDLGKAKEALDLIEASSSLRTSLSFERAYCLYRIGRLSEALSALNDVGPDRLVPRLQLEAQVQYRMGNYAQAITLYTQLLKEQKSDVGPEVAANIIAAYALGGRASEIPTVMSSMRATPRDNFELAFNTACGLIEEGILEEAEGSLTLARRVGEEAFFEEELDEQEVETELMPVDAQIAYVAAVRGRLAESVGGFSAVVSRHTAGQGGDDVTAAAAATDLASALLRSKSGDRKAASEALRALEPYVERSAGLLRVKASIEPRLGAAHSEALLTAYVASAMVANKPELGREALRSLEKLYKGSASAALLQAAQLSKDGKTKEAVAAFEALQGTAHAVSGRLMGAQIALAGGDVSRATAVLDALAPEVRVRPAVVATRVALKEKQANVEGAVQILQETVTAGEVDAVGMRWARAKLIEMESSRGGVAVAAEQATRLAAEDPAVLEDPNLLRLVSRLLACGDLSSQGPRGISPESLFSALHRPSLPARDVDALEAAGVAGSVGVRKNASGGKEEGAATGTLAPGSKRKNVNGVVEKEKKKRKRKKRLPKDYDPNNPPPPPDPERWMPKWQRAEAKKARKKRKDKDMVKGSQGAGKVDASLDRTGSASAPAAPPPQLSKSGPNKKKGKGKR